MNSIIEKIQKATNLERLNRACVGVVEFRTPNNAESFNLHDPDDLRPIRFVIDRGEYQATAAFRSLAEAKECAVACVREAEREKQVVETRVYTQWGTDSNL